MTYFLAIHHDISKRYHFALSPSITLSSNFKLFPKKIVSTWAIETHLLMWYKTLVFKTIIYLLQLNPNAYDFVRHLWFSPSFKSHIFNPNQAACYCWNNHSSLLKRVYREYQTLEWEWNQLLGSKNMWWRKGLRNSKHVHHLSCTEHRWMCLKYP